MSQQATADGILHLKGFAGGALLTPEHADLALAYLGEYKIHTVVFDGDLPQDGSYVNVLGAIHEQLPGVKIVAYRKESGVPSFKKAYSRLPYGGRIEIRSAPNDLAWDELGIHALSDTGARQVLLLGGGKTVLKEYEHASPEIRWTVMADISRPLKGKPGEYEYCSLLPLIDEKDNIVAL